MSLSFVFTISTLPVFKATEKLFILKHISAMKISKLLTIRTLNQRSTPAIMNFKGKPAISASTAL